MNTVWTHGQARQTETFDSVNPATSEVIATFPVHGRAEVDAAVERAGGLQHVGHSRARDGHEHCFGARHGVGDGGRACALPKVRRQRLRPGGMPCRERDVVAGRVPEPT